MDYAEIKKKTLDAFRWQDYRGSKEGMVIYFESSPSSKLPVRDVLNENGKGKQYEPSCETSTYGLERCVDPRTRNSFVKKRKGYLLFLTTYQGKNEEYKNRDFIIGYYRIMQSADVRKHHLRNYDDEMCPEVDYCYALRAGEFKFVAIEDGFELNSEKLKSWGYKGKIAKQLKMAFNEQKVTEILEHFSSKKDITGECIEEIEKLIQKIKPEETTKEIKEEETVQPIETN